MIDFQFRPFEFRYRSRIKTIKHAFQQHDPWMFSFYICAVAWREAQEWVLFSMAFNEVTGYKQEHAKVRLITFNRLFEFGVTKRKDVT